MRLFTVCLWLGLAAAQAVASERLCNFALSVLFDGVDEAAGAPGAGAMAQLQHLREVPNAAETRKIFKKVVGLLADQGFLADRFRPLLQADTLTGEIRVEHEAIYVSTAQP